MVIFSDIYCGHMVEFLEINLTVLLGSHLWLGPLWIFWLSNFSIVCLQQFRFFYPNNSSQGGFCSYVCSSKLRLPIFTCVSNLGGSDFPFLWIQEELLIFSVCPTFYLLGCIGSLQDPCMRNWKPVCCDFIFKPGFVGVTLESEQLMFSQRLVRG